MQYVEHIYTIFFLNFKINWCPIFYLATLVRTSGFKSSTIMGEEELKWVIMQHLMNK